MNTGIKHKIEKLLQGRGENYILPFFWQHGETEEVLREYMRVIHESNIGAVCVESRPHPDFLGEQWWKDMDVILDEARKRKMKVWILDDSHFPTGYANGALEDADPSLLRQSLVMQSVDCPDSGETMELSLESCQTAKPWKPNQMEGFIFQGNEPKTFSDDRLVSVTAMREGGKTDSDLLDLSGQIKTGKIHFVVPEGTWKLLICHLTRNRGPHRNYINMMDKKSCRVLIDTVYEAHYRHYAKDFGKTIAGFFSDEPEIGNGHLYEFGKKFYQVEDQAWSSEVEEELKGRWKEQYPCYLPLIWEQDFAPEMCAKIRYDYMDAVTRAVERDFSVQIGDWCRTHGVEYIGHLIEDNNQHSRTGSSLGHYFRGLAGQDMAGIDDIGGQVLPQGEEKEGTALQPRDGHFYHYVLGKLASSAAAADPRKQGRSMCEIFGNYGWSEGVHLEKYLLDHFLVRGINHYVPHAFSPKEFPDTDCPPHFYAHGNHPQYRHFGELMKYANRVCELISDGRHIAPVGILYHGESDWCGDCMMMQEPAMRLAENQIDYDFLPSDLFAERERYRTDITDVLHVNGQEYRVLIVPEYDYITQAAAEGILEMKKKGGEVIFVNRCPKGICNGGDRVCKGFTDFPCIALEELVKALETRQIPEVRISPESRYFRYLHYKNENDLYMFTNEGASAWTGDIHIKTTGACYAYNAWNNCLETVDARETESGTVIHATVEPLRPLILVFDETDEMLSEPVALSEKKQTVNGKWKRSICRSMEYPDFKGEKEVDLPDSLAKELPEFSGFVRYEKTINCQGGKMLLEISQASEGVEVFVNGESAGIQIAPPYRYDLSALTKEGENVIRIEAATTLEREMSSIPNPYAAVLGESPEPESKSGITGEVFIESK